MKKKTYCYENRTFEVVVSDEYRGWLVEIWVQEVIRPNRSSSVVPSFSTVKPLILTSMILLIVPYGLLLLMVWRKKYMTKLLMKNGRNGMKKLIKIAY